MSQPSIIENELITFANNNRPEFECLSGEFLWGQLQTVIMGHNNITRDSLDRGSVTPLVGGTILQNRYKYRVAARKGKWVVARFSSTSGYVAGFVVHHQDVSAQELLDRCKKVGISNNQGHEDKKIVYINRYDWSHHCGSSQSILDEIRKYNPDFTFPPHPQYASMDVYDEFNGGRFELIDAAQYDNLFKHFAELNHPTLAECCRYRNLESGSALGVHLSQKNTEYELGWMIYSGEKHADFVDDDELIGFVYDGSYCALEDDFEFK